MLQSEKKIFTSTPRKRTYLWDTGQGGILNSQKSQTRNLSDVNTAASRVYRVVLWSSENAERSSKKKKKTGTKKQKKTEFFNSQNLDKDTSLNSVTCGEGQQKTGDNLDDQVENKKQKGNRHKKRDQYKLHVNKEIQKLFSQKFSHDKKKDPLHLQDDNSKKHLGEKMLKVSSHKESAVANSYDNYANRKQRETRASSNHDKTVKKRNQKNCKRSSRDAEMNDKDKWEDDLVLKSSGQIGENDEDHIDTSNRRLKNKNNIGCLDTNEDDSSKNSEAGDIFDIWGLSQDSDQNDDIFPNRDSQNDRKRPQQLRKNKINSKPVPIKKNDSLNFSKTKNLKKNNKSCSRAKCSESIVKTRQVAQNSKTVPSSPHVNSSQVYDFPQSPNSGKSKAKTRKTSQKKKKDLKHDLVVDQILKIVCKTKMEIESMKEEILKKKTKQK